MIESFHLRLSFTLTQQDQLLIKFSRATMVRYWPMVKQEQAKHILCPETRILFKPKGLFRIHSLIFLVISRKQRTTKSRRSTAMFHKYTIIDKILNYISGFWFVSVIWRFTMKKFAIF